MAARRSQVEGVGVSFWAGKRVLLTGHTGFKGSWMSLWLLSLGAKLTGYALAPEGEPALFEQLGLSANSIAAPGTFAMRMRSSASFLKPGRTSFFISRRSPWFLPPTRIPPAPSPRM